MAAAQSASVAAFLYRIPQVPCRFRDECRGRSPDQPGPDDWRLPGGIDASLPLSFDHRAASRRMRPGRSAVPARTPSPHRITGATAVRRFSVRVTASMLPERVFAGDRDAVCRRCATGSGSRVEDDGDIVGRVDQSGVGLDLDAGAGPVPARRATAGRQARIMTNRIRVRSAGHRSRGAGGHRARGVCPSRLGL